MNFNIYENWLIGMIVYLSWYYHTSGNSHICWSSFFFLWILSYKWFLVEHYSYLGTYTPSLHTTYTIKIKEVLLNNRIHVTYLQHLGNAKSNSNLLRESNLCKKCWCYKCKSKQWSELIECKKWSCFKEAF